MAVIRPAPDQEYPVEVGWQNDRYSFSLSFSQRFCQRVSAVDLERAEIIGDDGRRQDVLGARHTSTLPELAEFRDRLNGAAAATDAAGVSFSSRAAQRGVDPDRAYALRVRDQR